MSVIQNNAFDAYDIYYYTEHNLKHVALFVCSKNKSFVGNIIFMESDAQLPPASIDNNGNIELYFYEKNLPAILNILQNEKPLYLYINTAVKTGWIQAFTEPVGEEES